MLQWLRNRRARRLTIHELLERWMAGSPEIPDGILQERALASPDATIYFLRERRLRLSNPGEVKRFVDLLVWLAFLKKPPVDAILELLQPFLEDPPSDSLQSAAMQAVCCLRHASAKPFLLRYFGTESDEFLTSSIQNALGFLRVREAIPRLVKNARLQKSAWIRSSACDAIARIGGSEAVAHLRDLYEHERNEKVRLQAAIGLVRNGERDVLDHLEKAFADPDPSLACEVAAYWLECGKLDCLDRILRRMESKLEGGGCWLLMLQGRFPQMPQLAFDRLWGPPLGRFKPRHARRSFRWLERHRPFLRWDPIRECFLTPHLPIPAAAD